jgi:hypothetical protein
VDAVLKGGDGGAGELHGITAKLWEGLSWIGRGWGGLPTVDRGFRRRRTRTATVDPGFKVKCEDKREQNGGTGSY